MLPIMFTQICNLLKRVSRVRLDVIEAHVLAYYIERPILNIFCYTKNCKIYKRREPAGVPTRIKELIEDSASCGSDTATPDDITTFELQGRRHNAYQRHDSASRLEQKHRHQLKTKRMHMCIWCKSKAQKGCCDKYSSEDRIKVTRVGNIESEWVTWVVWVTWVIWVTWVLWVTYALNRIKVRTVVGWLQDKDA